MASRTPPTPKAISVAVWMRAALAEGGVGQDGRQQEEEGADGQHVVGDQDPATLRLLDVDQRGAGEAGTTQVGGGTQKVLRVEMAWGTLAIVLFHLEAPCRGQYRSSIR